eukprot:scaffold5273_cov158-Skeletonema_menzelii.AAC.3
MTRTKFTAVTERISPDSRWNAVFCGAVASSIGRVEREERGFHDSCLRLGDEGDDESLAFDDTSIGHRYCKGVAFVDCVEDWPEDP